MNVIQHALYNRLLRGDKQLRKLFEMYVKNMGHSSVESKQIVESILKDKQQLLTESDTLAGIAKFGGNEQ